MQQQYSDYKIWRNFFASFLSSITIKTLVAPLERVKIFMQTDINNKRFKMANKGKEITNYRKYIKVSYTSYHLNLKLNSSTCSSKGESDPFGMEI